ncbi:Radical SAM domain-containing protein [Desulfonema limicola]|uniref:Radical SAM domain-containing protein n=1 Tax=Desulfonema limicola TaxID=45656 RepID=A0A975B3I0_9BACT|nr:AmmeMemoRadiSam system radical SAM enzyme [Desulfonema limicola]QTA78106.1 Radical SAM domain-containing protein [Desulfonema limicola]
MKAFLYENIDQDKIRCNLCSHRCIIKPGKRGICGVRENNKGVLTALTYNRIIARAVDPIEKKPLFHFLPSSLSYSIAAAGCNFKCRFCQNSGIAQMPSDYNGKIEGYAASPGDIVRDALKTGCQSISYTYTEPTVFFEMAYETAELAHEKGIKNVFVSNGYMTCEAIDMISPFLDAANIDLKAYTDDFYKTYCSAKLEPVKQTLKYMKSRGIFVEVTTLIIPGLNDGKSELESLSRFIAEELGTETPWHISRFHPAYKLADRPATPLETLIKARDIGVNAGLKYVYMGNVPGQGGEDTVCYQCGKTLIQRWGFNVKQNRVKNGCCPDCGAEIHGVGI